jgi:hypothetical protein
MPTARFVGERTPLLPIPGQDKSWHELAGTERYLSEAGFILQTAVNRPQHTVISRSEPDAGIIATSLPCVGQPTAVRQYSEHRK